MFDFSLNGNVDVKISGFKQSKQAAEPKTHIEDAVSFLTVIAAKALGKGAGVEARDVDAFFLNLQGGDAGTLTGTKAAQPPAVASGKKDSGQQHCKNKKYR